MKIFITGPPGVGKTTLIERIIRDLDNVGLCGFITKEVREGGSRVGFKVIGLSSKEEGILAWVNIDSVYRVGRYGVDIISFEAILQKEMVSGKLYVIDEVGKMELFSEKFRDYIQWLIESKNSVLGTLSKMKHPLIEKIKNRADVTIYELTRANFDNTLDRLKEIYRL